MSFSGLSVWDAVAVALKAAAYATTFVAAGGVLFLLVCADPLNAADRHRIDLVIGRASLLAVVITAVRLPVLAGVLGGDAAGVFDASLLRMVLESGEQRASLLRIAGLVLACAALSPLRWLLWPALVGAVLAITSFTWLGHEHALAYAAVAIALQAVHLLCAAFWVGALLPLRLIALHDARGTRIAAAASGFGRVALWSVAGLLLAGLGLLGLMLAGDVSGLTGAYGRTALAKLLLVAVLMALAAYNKLRLTPRLCAGDAVAASQLAFTIRCESILAALILAATAVLTSLMGPPALD